ncbi:PepSY-associated TM helix domain-containing protein [Dongia rigui]|uniref:PepSY-associated TM helix domain-containing protein n=1 Tax=Dongia rigui TaxID=940149 RepID=A0ABU5E220_9PROT|nr:PepSY-associated TM helix domain-containing protein [Dongia rigui]MDY0873549.1 PepSY-associated TM helix domain-containing protein [Dongia rigui]
MKRMTFRQLLQEIHLWLALILFVPLVILGLTGSILVYHDDFPSWFGSDETRYTLVSGTPRPVGAIVAAAQSAMGEGVKPAAITLPAVPGEPALVRFARAQGQASGQGQSSGQGQATGQAQAPAQGGGAPQGGPGGMMGGGQVRIDPVSLAVLDVQKGMNRQGGFFGVMHQLHGSLMIPGAGRDIVGWLGVVMLFLGVSGLIIWWPRPGQWRQQLTIKRNATTLRLNRDLHNTFGFWGLAVFVIVSFTGLYIVYPQPINAVVGLVTPVRDLRPNAVTVQPQEGVTPIDIATAVGLGDAAVAHEQKLQGAFMPQRPDQPYRLSYALPGESSTFFNTTVFVDPWKAQVIEVRDPREMSAGDTFALYQRPLHYGFGWGPIWQFLVFLSGLLPLLFSITGLTMWWMKRRRRQNAALARQMAE